MIEVSAGGKGRAAMQTGNVQPLGDTLKGRELEVLRLIAAGWSNREIADELYLARETVRWYIKQLYGKLGVNDRAEAVAAARTLGLLDETSPPAENFEPARAAFPQHNLPAQITPFVGREPELDELARLLADDSLRLVTLLAPGGMGKTRLALQAVEQHIAHFPDGVFFAPLAALSSPEQLVSAIGENIPDFRFRGGGEPKRQLLDFLREKRIVLLLDNFEHLLAGAALLTDILQAAPFVKLLVTSRERLHLSGEIVFTVGGMDYPDSDAAADPLDYSAVKLFVQQARLARRDYTVTENDLPGVTRICRLTAGMPLGIVLAAAWIEMLSPGEIADEIGQSLDFLVAEKRDQPERLRSVRAVFDYSWKRLSEAEQASFRRMSVFRGGFTRQAAQAVAGASVQALQALVNKALVTRMPSGRYEAHELLRQYVEGQLELSGEVGAARDAHSRYYLDMMAALEADIKGRRQAEAMGEIDADFPNVWAAWNWALMQGHLEWIDKALECISWFAWNSNRYQDTTELFRQAEHATQNKIETQLLWMRVAVREPFGLMFWNPAAALKLSERLQRALEIARMLDNRAETAWCQFALASNSYLAQDFSTAFDLFDESLAHFHALNDRFYSAWALMFMGSCTRHLRGISESTGFFQKSLELRQAVGDKFGEYVTKTNFGINLLLTGSLPDAETLFSEPDVVAGIEGFCEAIVGLISFLRGDTESAVIFGKAALQRIAKSRFVTTQSLALSLQGVLACIDERYTESVALGQEARGVTSLSYAVFFADWALALAYCGLGDYEAARESTQAALDYACTVRASGAMTWCLPPAAVILACQGDGEGAVELLSLAYHHPNSEGGWLDQWPLIARLRHDLEAELGVEVIGAAWERGKSLDLEPVAANLLAKYNALNSR